MDDQAPAPVAEATDVAMAVEDNSQQPTPVVETNTSTEPATDGQVEQAPTDEPTPAETSAEVERQPSRAERRIQQLTGQLKEVTAKSSANSQLPQLPTQAPKLSDLLQGQDTIDPAELDKIVEQREQAARGYSNLEVQQLRHELTQQRAVDEVEKEAAVLPTRYEGLNPDSPKYMPLVEQKIEAEYKARDVIRNPMNPSQMMVDPSVRLSEIAKDFVDVARAAAEQGKAQTSASLATQIDNSAITPTSDAPHVKSVEEMTEAEHYAYLKSKGYDI